MQIKYLHIAYTLILLNKKQTIIFMKKSFHFFALLMLIAVGFSSCKKDETKKNYTVPTTYTFDSVYFSNSNTRLLMISELLSEIKKANTLGTVVTAQRLNDLFTNNNSPFSNTALNTSGLQLKNQVITNQQTVIESLFSAIETTSQASQAGSDGVAGVVGTGSAARLLDANGIEYKESVEKGLFGALLNYQICEVLLSPSNIGASVNQKTRQQSWDAAFGYYGIPIDFPTNKTGLLFIGKYGNDRDTTLLKGINSTIMTAFLKGRAAIDNNDNDEVSTQAAIVKESVERVLAATAINYLTTANANFGNDVTRCHTLSEFRGLLKALSYSSTKKITDAQIADISNTIGNSNWTITQANILSARTTLAAIYGLNP